MKSGVGATLAVDLFPVTGNRQIGAQPGYEKQCRRVSKKVGHPFFIKKAWI